MDDAAKKDLEIVVSRIIEQLDGVEAIYLFGSLARGTENAESDYDVVAFVSKLPSNDTEAIFRVRYPLIGKLKRQLDFIVIGLEDLLYPSVILYNIHREARLLYGRDVLKDYERIASGMKPVVVNGATVGYYV
jgi:predicted nucleotidyltransferase